MQRGTFQWMKSLNKSIILNKIRTSGPISRAQIAKETSLTPPTVGSIVKELIEQNIVKESTLGTSQGGRKPTMLVVNSRAFYIIGVDAGPRDIEFIISDLSGQIIGNDTSLIEIGISKEQFIQQLQEGISRLLTQFKKFEVIGIGVAMHGVVDVETGTSLFAPNLNLRNIPIKQELESVFDMEVKVENDARSLVLGEAWFGPSDNPKSMMAVNVGRGIGAGIVIDGKLYHGENGIAGEIGHMTLDVNGKKCECGNVGCLQTVAAGPAIADRAKEMVKQGATSLLTGMIENNLDNISGTLIHQAALKGDHLSKQILLESGKHLGIALTNLIHIINPSKIIIGGGVSKAGSFILDPVKTTIKERALTERAKQTEVVLSDLGDHATALGSVALILLDIFQPNLNN